MQQAYIRAMVSEFGEVAVFSTVSRARQDAPADAEDGIPTSHAALRRGPLRSVAKALDAYRYFAKWAGADGPEATAVLFCYNTFTLHALLLRVLQLRFGVRTIPIAITLPYDYGSHRPGVGHRLNALVSGALLRHVDGVVAITEPLARRVNAAAPALVVRGAVQPDAIASNPASTPAAGLRLAYAGTLYDRYQLRSLVAMLDLLEEPGTELHFYGRGPLAEWLEDAASTRSDVFFHGALPLSELRIELEQADVQLVLLDPFDELATFSFPSKIFEALATGRPVMVSDLSTLDPRMRGFLAITTDLSPSGLALAVTRLRQRPAAEWLAMGQAGLDYLRDFGTWPAVGRQLKELVTVVSE